MKNWHIVLVCLAIVFLAIPVGLWLHNKSLSHESQKIQDTPVIVAENSDGSVQVVDKNTPTSEKVVVYQNDHSLMYYILWMQLFSRSGDSINRTNNYYDNQPAQETTWGTGGLGAPTESETTWGSSSWDSWTDSDYGDWGSSYDSSWDSSDTGSWGSSSSWDYSDSYDTGSWGSSSSWDSGSDYGSW